MHKISYYKLIPHQTKRGDNKWGTKQKKQYL